MAQPRILPFAAAPETESPMIAAYEIDGHPFEAVVWTPEAWGRLDEDDRPDDAVPIGGGYWHQLRRRGVTVSPTIAVSPSP